MKILHIVPGLDNPFNGIAVAAKLIAGEQAAEMVDAREFGKIKDLAKYGEVWVHSCWLPKTLIACCKVLRAKRPFVRMTHANLDPVRLRYHGWKKWLVGPIERYLLRKADRIVVTCEAEAEWVRMYLGKKCPAIEVMDLKRFFKLNHKIHEIHEKSSAKLNVLYLGRRHPLKGVKYLEKAVKELGVRSQWVGVRDVENNSKLETRNLELKIVSNAFGEELEKVWEWCDVLVLPTLSENFGLVVAEALERGKMVITTDGAPVWECLEGGSQALGFSVGYGGRLIYLKGYRDGGADKRIELLKKAIAAVSRDVMIKSLQGE